MQGETIAAIATPVGRGGIGIVRISGEKAFAVAQRVFKSVRNKALPDMKGYSAAFGHVFQGNEEIDECVALVYRAPHSYTGEDTVELSCHGGIYLMRRVLSAVIQAGARLAHPGEFTKRAFLNGKVDLTRAEAVMDLVNANGKAAASAAISQHEGALFRKIQDLKAVVYDISSDLDAYFDFPTEDIPELEPQTLCERLVRVQAQLEQYIDTYEKGRIIREGVDTVIAGKPNVGKSTIMNRISGYEKSIVTEIPGTTRDIVQEDVEFAGLTLRLSDTAGLRKTDDPVEKIGVERARKKIETAGLVLAVFDASCPMEDEDFCLVDEAAKKNAVAVINKADLPQKLDLSYIKRNIKQSVNISASSGEGMQDLEKIISKMAGKIDSANGILANQRQLSCAVRANDGILLAIKAIRDGMTLDAVSTGVEQAADALSSLTGERASEEVIDRVFAKFCVGK